MRLIDHFANKFLLKHSKLECKNIFPITPLTDNPFPPPNLLLALIFSFLISPDVLLKYSHYSIELFLALFFATPPL